MITTERLETVLREETNGYAEKMNEQEIILDGVMDLRRLAERLNYEHEQNRKKGDQEDV